MTTINSKSKMRIRKYTGTYNQAKDGTVREVDLELGLSRDESRVALGDTLTDAVFAGYTDGEESGGGHWKLKNPKPSSRVVCSQHSVKIDGDGFVVQPRLRAFQTVEDTQKIVAIIRLQLGVAQVALRKKLEDRVGEEVHVEIEPSELPLPLGETSNLSDRQLEIVKGAAT